MFQSHEYTGIWFLPGAQDRHVVGTLRFDQSKGATLELVGNLAEDLEMVLSRESAAPGIIHGLTAAGKKMTLCRCHSLGGSLTFPGLTTTRFGAEFLFVGAHLPTEESISIRQLFVEFSHLDEWAGISGLKGSLSIEGVGGSGQIRNLTVSYQPPE